MAKSKRRIIFRTESSQALGWEAGLVRVRIPLVVQDVRSLIEEYVSLELRNVIDVIRRGICLVSVLTWKGGFTVAD